MYSLYGFNDLTKEKQRPSNFADSAKALYVVLENPGILFSISKEERERIDQLPVKIEYFNKNKENGDVESIIFDIEGSPYKICLEKVRVEDEISNKIFYEEPKFRVVFQEEIFYFRTFENALYFLYSKSEISHMVFASTWEGILSLDVHFNEKSNVNIANISHVFIEDYMHSTYEELKRCIAN